LRKLIKDKKVIFLLDGIIDSYETEKEKGIYLLQKSKRRVKERMLEITALFIQNKITEEKAAERVCSVFAAIALARTNRFPVQNLSI